MGRTEEVKNAKDELQNIANQNASDRKLVRGTDDITIMAILTNYNQHPYVDKINELQESFV